MIFKNKFKHLFGSMNNLALILELKFWRIADRQFSSGQGRRYNANWGGGGGYIHIFRFCPTSFFVIKLISKEFSRA